jgi:hypothetical protein
MENTACTLISKLTNKFKRMSKANSDINRLKEKDPKLITPYITQELSIFEDDLEYILNELQTAFDSMERGLQNRQKLMTKHNIEDEYQKSKTK